MVLFTSNKSLERAENIKAVYAEFDGDKRFTRTVPGHRDRMLSSHAFSMRVCDEFIGASPGRAIMIGHGIAGGKTYGLDQPYPYHNRSQARLLTYVVTTSKAMIPLVARQSGVPESRVVALGMPRTDVYFRRKDGGTFLTMKRCYLYAPTFRNKRELPETEIDFALIDSLLTDDELFVVKPHNVTHTIMHGKQYKHVVEVSSDTPSAPYLIDCAVLVTDFSSIMFDAHVIGKPVVLYAPDRTYLTTRGMYLRYPDEYASRFADNEHDLVDICRAADAPQAADIRCRELTAGACDGHSTERVIQLIKETEKR